MAALITAAEYPEVRAAIDVSLTEEHIPNSVIAMGIYHGLAERKILELYPAAADDTTNADTVKRATIYMLASVLAPAVPMLTKESMGLYSYTRREVDLNALVDNLRDMAETELASIPGVINNNIIPTMFTVARGTRGA